MGAIIRTEEEGGVKWLSANADKISAMKWSYSRLSAFEQCRYSFYLKYIIDEEDMYLAESNYWAELGSFMHEILEKVFRGELLIEDAATYFIDNYDNQVLYTASPHIMQKSYNACLDYLTEVDLSWIELWEILGVEYKVDFEIDGYRFTGYIDLLLKNKESGDIVVLDHKSAAYPLSEKTGNVLKSHATQFESYKKQMYLYSLAIKELFGKYPKWILWNHFKAGRIVEIPFKLSECRAAKRWMIDTIHKIENEEDFPESMDYFYCHHLCDFRNSCEYRLLGNGAEE